MCCFQPETSLCFPRVTRVSYSYHEHFSLVAVCVCVSARTLTLKLSQISAFCLVAIRIDCSKISDEFACQGHRSRSVSFFSGVGGFKVTRKVVSYSVN